MTFIFIAQIIAKSVNESVNPCDNFYRFSCDKWKSKHTIADDKQFFGLFLCFNCKTAINECWLFVESRADILISNETWFNQLPFELIVELMKRETFKIEEWKKCKK
ncbi:hypothetical protein B4U80_15013 [Leptotrombidium deliense]|uniref:Peptidase M13 N-terminal domain-containing protein n=1 Tax=Leptotrombidium deliense TaxID=299467 RepID=A0A443RTQ4_9ACAR|nr:hypothetical protein B4U80_15013 [Leptotrombidium deliense]